VVAYIGLGANLGAPRQALASATRELAVLAGGDGAVRSSSIYRSEPIDASGPDYCNAVVELRTSLGPLALLRELQRIEAAHGRERGYRHAPRTLDLDLLLYGDTILDSAELTLPHPRLGERAFVLLPLAEIAPGLVIPGIGCVTGLLAGVAGQRIDRL
jgi:2-amino-4-hydroxy-6-hydroxymethyldihydropteridine diphosphokinase